MTLLNYLQQCLEFSILEQDGITETAAAPLSTVVNLFLQREKISL